ncbi:PREDICTED: uncharacterized protein LOC104592694 [Nelumbo nucifera]|uniref:Uncharacterized protein LOC104592694 n=1 Tax=Nelumbo nucifera TaxID=4432 RepID=A0A1U7ZCI4_NELNU|nr:PREDICTED: uncharacterized protein LOC104592694 [Nelumbo nucifera]
MGASHLTISVLNLSPIVTCADVFSFFSYCGAVDKIELVRNEDESQMAFVTFRQHYALQTALLLNNAVIVDHPIRILPPQSQNLDNTSRQQKRRRRHYSVVQQLQQDMGGKGYQALNMKNAQEEIEVNYKLSEKGRVVLSLEGRLTISASDHTRRGVVGSIIMDNEYLSAVAVGLDKAAKCVAQLANYDQIRHPYSKCVVL